VADVDDIGKRVYESYAAFRASVAPWTRRSEEAYTLARRAALDI
jgi:TRAP-type mannitol/chloroaromatic compound transport system substrate-binding protein